MFARLHRRFVLITVALLSLVLLAVFCGSVISTWQTQKAELNAALSQELQPRLGSSIFLSRPFGYDPFSNSTSATNSNSATNNSATNTNSATNNSSTNTNSSSGSTSSNPLSSLIIGGSNAISTVPVAVVLLDATHRVITADAGQVAIASDLQARALAALHSQTADSGLLLSLGLAYQRLTFADGSSAIAFASTDALVRTTSQTALFMGLICLAALLVILGISVLLGRLAMRPAVEAWQRQQRFVADASHALNTPLAAVLANTGILLADLDKLNPEQRRWLNSSQIEARRMDELVRNLLALARIDQLADKTGGPARPAATPVNLSELTQKSLLQFEAIFFERHMELTVAVAEGVIIQGWPGELEQLLGILLDNASKYAEPGGWVHVGLDSERFGHARLRVANSGVPIPADKLPHICERFYRGDESHGGSIEGFGLGLALAQAIAGAHHASLNITSDATNGTVVSVEF